MRIRNKRRRHYANHGWKKFLDSWFEFNYETTFSDPYTVNDQLIMDVGVNKRSKGMQNPLPDRELEIDALDISQLVTQRGKALMAKDVVVLVGTPTGDWTPLLPYPSD